jgi:hypothetical protein
MVPYLSDPNSLAGAGGFCSRALRECFENPFLLCRIAKSGKFRDFFLAFSLDLAIQASGKQISKHFLRVWFKRTMHEQHALVDSNPLGFLIKVHSTIETGLSKVNEGRNLT